MIDVFRKRPTLDAERRRQVQAWIRDRLDLSQHASISELRCDESGCPPVETFVGVLLPGSSQRKFKIHKPFGQVSLANLETATAEGCKGIPDD